MAEAAKTLGAIRVLKQDGSSFNMAGDITLNVVSPLKVINDNGQLTISVDPEAVLFFKRTLSAQLMDEKRPLCSINSAGAMNDGTMFVLGGACTEVGLFSGFGATGCHGTGDPVGVAQVENVPARLHVYDMCLPDIDCSDYKEIYGLLMRLAAALEKMKDDILAIPVRDPLYPNVARVFGLMRQYHALIYYWNYLVKFSFLTLRIDFSCYFVSVFISYRYYDFNTVNGATVDAPVITGGALTSLGAPKIKIEPTQNVDVDTLYRKEWIYRFSRNGVPGENVPITVAVTWHGLHFCSPSAPSITMQKKVTLQC